MTDEAIGDVKPCAFCGAEFEIRGSNAGPVAIHPGVITDGSCVLAGGIFHEDKWPLLNKRPSASELPLEGQ